MADQKRTLAIKRVGEMKKIVTLTLNINSATDPDVARWVWEHPYVASGVIRKLIRGAIARERAAGRDPLHSSTTDTGGADGQATP